MTDHDPHCAPNLQQSGQETAVTSQSCGVAPKTTHAWQARRRLEQIFGKVLPEQSQMNADDAEENERRYRRDIPPHYGQQ